MEKQQETKEITLSAKFYKKLIALGITMLLLLVLTSVLAFYFYLKSNNAQQQQEELNRVNQLQQEQLEELNTRTQDLEGKLQKIWQLQQEVQKGGSPRPDSSVKDKAKTSEPVSMEKIAKRLDFLEETYRLRKPALAKLEEDLTQRIITAQLNHYKGNPHIPTLWPTTGEISSPFGLRWNNTDFHPGIDIANDLGTPIYATADGVVTSAGWNAGGYGNMVDIDHGDHYMTRYAHASYVVVQAGQQVKRGQIIAYMGSTGFSTGPHLHYEVRINNQAVNPASYLLEHQ